MILSLLFAAAPMGLMAQDSSVQTPPTAAGDLAAVFGFREMVQDASLSPDGTKLAFVKPIGGQGSMLMVVDLTSAPQAPKAVLKLDGEPNRMGQCKWVGNARLMCEVFASVDLLGDATYASRMVSVDAAGGEPKVLELRKTGTGQQLGLVLYGGDVIDWNPGEDGYILVMREFVPQSTISAAGTSTLISQSKTGIGVDLVNTRTLQSKTIEQPKQDARRYISDGYGNLRIKAHRIVEGDYDTGRYNYYYRKADSRDWLPMVVTDPSKTTFLPVAVDAKQNLAYGLKRVDGRIAAFSYSLDGIGTETLVYSHPDVDVAGFVTIGRRSRVIGVRYVTDVAQVHYLDPDIQKMAAALARSLPQLPLIRVVDSSEDERKMLIWAGSDINPGRYLLFDRDAKTLSQLLAVRPDVESLALSAMKPMTFAARDGTQVPGYLTLPPGKSDLKGLPAIVMPHGGPSLRDEWGFEWLAQYFAQAGYAVLQPNFRGSAGFGEAWFQQNGFRSWQTAIGDINDAGHWMVSNGADPRRLAIFGWSYGGYAALQSNVMEPDLFKAVVAVAPVTDLERLKADRRNWSDYEMVAAFVGDGPHVEQGSPSRNAANFKAPVLMFHGDIDRNVDVGHSKLMDNKLKSAGKQSELHVYQNRDHYLEDSAIRAEMLRTSSAFMEKAFAGQ